MSSVVRVKFIKTKVIFRYHTKGVSNQVSINSDHEIKSYSCSNSSIKIGKNEKLKKKKFWAIRVLQIGEGFKGLQIGARGITNRGSLRDFKIETKKLQIRAGISNRGRN